jgi:uncharacterized protein (DUF111 family)
MECFAKPGSLVLVQVDHLSGEMLGEIWEQLSSKGAKNVQFLSTLTKKGRPGYLLLIDISPERMSELEDFLVSDLGVCGWHRLLSEHVHVGTEVVSHELIFRTPNGRLQMKVAGKRIKNSSVSVRPEHDGCILVQTKLREEGGLEVPLREIERIICEAMNSLESQVTIDLSEGRQLSPDSALSLVKAI